MKKGENYFLLFSLQRSQQRLLFREFWDKDFMEERVLMIWEPAKKSYNKYKVKHLNSL